MTAEDFIKAYESALASQKWGQVDPLLVNEVCVTFSNGTVHKGKVEVQKAFENNFNTIKSEKYLMTNITWLKREDHYAAYLFDYNWSGLINGKSVAGRGVGTSIIIKEKGYWRLLAEHLGKRM